MKTIENIFKWMKYWYSHNFKRRSIRKSNLDYEILGGDIITKETSEAIKRLSEAIGKMGLSSGEITRGFTKDCSKDK